MISECELSLYNVIVEEYKYTKKSISIYYIIIGLMKILKKDNTEQTKDIIKNCLLLCLPLLHSNEIVYT